jgi:hypothetical protein
MFECFGGVGHLDGQADFLSTNLTGSVEPHVVVWFKLQLILVGLLTVLAARNTRKPIDRWVRI